MSQTLTPTGTFLDQGKVINDISAAAAAPTSVDLLIPNSGDMVLFVANVSGAPITATLNAVPNQFGRGAAANNEVATVPAAEIGMISFMKPGMFNTAGLASVTLSTITNVKVALYRLTKAR